MHDGGLYIAVHGWPEMLTSLDSSGDVRPGWPIAVASDSTCDIAVAADDSLRVVCGATAFAFDILARPLEHWPVELGGESRAIAVRGRILHAQIAKRRWVSVGPDGALEPREGRMPEASRYSARIRIPVDRWGEPTAAKPWKVILSGAKGALRGWPVLVPGSASEPVVGEDGTVYLVALGERDGTSRLIVIGRSGKRIASRSAVIKDIPPHDGSWYGPYTPQSPVVGPDGSVWVVGRSSAWAFDPRGRLRAGWPVKLRGEPGSTGYCGPCGDIDCYTLPTTPFIDRAGTLYVLRAPVSKSAGGSVVAIGLDGKVVSGWPVRLKRAGSEFWYGKVGPDGTVFVDAYEPEPRLRRCPEAMSLTTLALRPDGSMRYRVTLVDP